MIIIGGCPEDSLLHPETGVARVHSPPGWMRGRKRIPPNPPFAKGGGGDTTPPDTPAEQRKRLPNLLNSIWVED